MPISRKPLGSKNGGGKVAEQPRGRSVSSRPRPSLEGMEEQVEHSYQHRGESGKYGNIYKEDVKIFRPKETKHEVCIVPWQVKENSEFRTLNPDFNKPFDSGKLKSGEAWPHKLTVLIHGNIGANQDNVLCLRTLKRECPICIRRAGVYDQADAEGNKEKADALKKQADALGPSKRAIYNVFCFDNEEEMKKGVQIWEAPHQSIEDVLSGLWKDERTGEKRYYMVPEEGWNVYFKKEGKGLGTKYTSVQIVKRQERDEFNEEELEDLYSAAYNIEELIEVKTPAEIKELMSGMSEEEASLLQDGDEPSPEREQEPPQEEEPRTSRFRGGKGKEEPEKPKGRTPAKESPEGEIPEEYAECFGVQCNQRDPECESCPEKVFEMCYKETNKKGKK